MSINNIVKKRVYVEQSYRLLFDNIDNVIKKVKIILNS